MDHTISRSTRLYHRRRDEFISSRGGLCEQCGSGGVLEIDHIDRATKSLAPGDALMRRADVRESELAKCQVLCADCHKNKTRSEFIGGCGTRSGYRKHKCRCDDCKRWYRDYWRMLRARYKARDAASSTGE